MKKLMKKKPLYLFATIFTPIMVCILLLITLQSSWLFSKFETLALDLVYSSMKSDLQNMSKSASIMRDSVKALAVQALFDADVNDMLYTNIDDIEYTKHISRLQSYKNIYPFLDSIYIYNGKAFYVYPGNIFLYDKKDFPDKDIIKVIENPKKFQSHSLIARKIPVFSDARPVDMNERTSGYSYLLYDSLLQDSEIGKAIILNISEKWLRDFIENFRKNSSSRILIINQAGISMTEDTFHPMLSDLSSNGYIKKVLASKEPIGYIRADADSVDSIITYVAEKTFGWRYISITPYSQISSKVGTFKKVTFFIVFIIMGLGTAASIFLSIRLYKPINELILDLDILESQKKKDEFHIKKQELIINLINNKIDIKSVDFNNYLKSLGITLNPSNDLTIIMFTIDCFSQFCNKYNLHDRELVKFGLMSMVSKILSPMFINDSFDTYENQFVTIMNYENDLQPSVNQELQKLIREIQVNAAQNMEISLSITLGEKFNSLDQLGEYYNICRDNSFFRFITGHGSIIHQGMIGIKEPVAYSYPYEMEKHFIEKLMQGNIDKSKELFMEIIREAMCYGQSVINSTMLRIFLSLNNAIEAIQKSNKVEIDYNFNYMFDKLRDLETLDDVKSMFYQLFDMIQEKLDHKRNIKYEKLVENVITIIHDQYSNPNLTLESIAENVGISYSYLSSLFKNRKLISINDYINNLRIKKAKELLMSTDEPMNVIMEKAGFLSRSNFHVMFKKIYGITPSQCRKQK